MDWSEQQKSGREKQKSQDRTQLQQLGDTITDRTISIDLC